MSKCLEPGCKNEAAEYDLICWECSDMLIMDKWHKRQEFNIPETLQQKVDTYYKDMTQKQKDFTAKTEDQILEDEITIANKRRSDFLAKLDAKYEEPSKTTLPTDSQERKNYPLLRGCLRYFPAALAGVSRTSHVGNLKHNPGEEMYHNRGKSGDHGDCILRHLIDLQDLLAAKERGAVISDQQILDEASSLAWRSLALSQELHEELAIVPMAPGAKK